MYSPKVKEDLIPVLYQLAQQRDRPMTKIIDEILREHLEREGFLKQESSLSAGRLKASFM